MPAKTYLIEGEDEVKQEIFSTPSKTLLHKNVGQNPIEMHVVAESPAYNEETVLLPGNQDDFQQIPIVVDRVKFTFTAHSKIELIEVY